MSEIIHSHGVPTDSGETGHVQVAEDGLPKPVGPANADHGRWLRFCALLIVTAVALVPIGVVVVLSLRPRLGSSSKSWFSLGNFSYVFHQTMVLTWLRNSVFVSLLTVIVAVVVAAPAGYVLSRARSKLVSAWSLSLFVVQSLPIITIVIPLFIVFAEIGLVDNLVGVTIIYVGSTVAVATWMMAAYIDTIPMALEEAAWIDGCSVFTGFVKVVLRNSLPGILSTAIFAWLQAWNDYLVALVFLRSSSNFTLPVGVESFFQLNSVDWGAVMATAVVMLAPPVIVFGFLNRFFSLGGIAGSLAGT
jgi:multiple sugar transport system permease protein